MKLTKDTLFLIATKLELPDLLNFCLTNKKVYQSVYLRKDIWFYKLKEFSNNNWCKLDPKDKYLLLFLLSEVKVKLNIDKSLFYIYKLESLSYTNKLKSIPKGVGKLTNLRSLYLSLNNIEEIPKEICLLTNLKKLGLSYNKLRRLPKEIENLQQLKSLYLNRNLFDEWPSEINGLIRLEKIYLNRNFIKHLPKEISKLINLKSLYLENNLIKDIPKEILDMENLEQLCLKRGQIDVSL